MEGTRLARATISFPRNRDRLFHEERGTDRTINTATLLAGFLAIVRVEIVQRYIHDVFVRVHHATNPKFSLRGDEE